VPFLRMYAHCWLQRQVLAIVINFRTILKAWCGRTIRGQVCHQPNLTVVDGGRTGVQNLLKPRRRVVAVAFSDVGRKIGQLLNASEATQLLTKRYNRSKMPDTDKSRVERG
jgi:hypothetical protein